MTRAISSREDYDGESWRHAAEVGGVTVKIIRDWVVRFKKAVLSA